MCVKRLEPGTCTSDVGSLEYHWRTAPTAQQTYLCFRTLGNGSRALHPTSNDPTATRGASDTLQLHHKEMTCLPSYDRASVTKEFRPLFVLSGFFWLYPLRTLFDISLYSVWPLAMGFWPARPQDERQQIVLKANRTLRVHVRHPGFSS